LAGWADGGPAESLLNLERREPNLAVASIPLDRVDSIGLSARRGGWRAPDFLLERLPGFLREDDSTRRESVPPRNLSAWKRANFS
jgi:hypothetical protein